MHLTYSSRGTGNFGYLAVMGRKSGEAVQKAIGLVGDRVQICEARVADRAIVLDVLQAGPGDGMCCPSQLATRTFSIRNGEFVETAAEVTGIASISMLEDKEWVLRTLDGDQRAMAAARATLTFESSRVSGSAGCNRYQGTVGDVETATSLLIGPLTSTRMACPKPIMAQERAFLDLPEKAEVFQFLLGDLVLSGSKGTLVFSPRSD